VKTEVLSALTDHDETVRRAVERLKNGDPVGLPTETVYGLAADALREEAVLKIFEAKSRPRFDPLIVHLPDAEAIGRVAFIDPSVKALFDKLQKSFWPGPLTFIFPRRAVVSDWVTAGLKTVAVRLSAHPIFAEIVRSFGGPLAAPSANRFGRISPTTAAHVHDELEGLIPLIVDAGPTAHGLESTIVALRNGRIEILRRGPITEEQLAEFGEVSVIGPTLHPEAPGQLPSHYAPRTPLQLVDDPANVACPAGKRCGLLAWNRPEAGQFAEVRRLSKRQDVVEAATNLFRLLRELDGQNLDLIIAEMVPDQGLGAAINDRLRRAATPREAAS
jgi:L-threonylcarbamoyladenylate synthase